jgi:cytidine deaminase
LSYHVDRTRTKLQQMKQSLGGFIETDSLASFSPEHQELILAARKAIDVSHSPYSNFKVGCAVRLRDGQIITGANQENASYGLTVCAERTTILSVFNLGKKNEIIAIAVTAKPGNADANYRGPNVISPCGACRQVIREAEDLSGQPISILMDCFNDDLVSLAEGISHLLPMGFGPADLGISLK